MGPIKKHEEEERPVEDRVTKCPECGSEEFVYEKGQHYCKKCGLEIEE